MTCKPCRLTFNGTRYHIERDGTVRPVLLSAVGAPAGVEFVPGQTLGAPMDAATAAAVRHEAARLRRNRNTRARHDAMRSIGMVRTPYGWE